MSRRVTIGAKPTETGPEPMTLVDPADMGFSPDLAIRALEALSARAAGAKPADPGERQAEAWVRRGDDPEPDPGVISPPAAAPTADAWIRGDNEAAFGAASEAFPAPGQAADAPVPLADSPQLPVPAVASHEEPGEPIASLAGGSAVGDQAQAPPPIPVVDGSLLEIEARPDSTLRDPDPASAPSAILAAELPEEPATPTESRVQVEALATADGPIVAGEPDLAQVPLNAEVAPQDGVPAAAPAAYAPLAAVAAPWAAGWRPMLPGILLGAAVGAVVAALAMAVFLPGLMPSVDLRLAPIVDRVVQIERQAERAGRDVGQLNNEIAQAIDADARVAAAVTEQNAELADIRRQLEESARAAGEGGVDPSVFAVAVAQLREAFYSGRPFEAELVTVYALVRDDQRFLGLLNELSAPARTGLPNAVAMRQQLWALVAAAGLQIGGAQSYYDYATSLVSQYLGFTTEPYPVEEANIAVTQADRKLIAGDVAGAVEMLGRIDPAVAAPLQPWLVGARTYLRAESAITDMTDAVVDNLRKRMGNMNAG